MGDMTGMTTMVVGASRGLGRGVAEAFADAGAPVVAIARGEADLADLTATVPGVAAEVADARDEDAAAGLLARHRPDVLVLVAGAPPAMDPLQAQTWATFSLNWHADVRIAFSWLRAALLLPLAPGARVIVVSSGAALHGSPASGGYAGAKAMQRFMAAYAQGESDAAGLGLTVTAVMPALTPLGEVGRAGVRAYAARSGRTEEEFVAGMGDLLTPAIAGAALLGLARTDPAGLSAGYVLTAAGLQEATAAALPSSLPAPVAGPARLPVDTPGRAG